MAEDDLTRIQPLKGSALALRSQDSGALYPLSGEILVGREVECDIQLTSPQVSRYHAKVYVSATGLYIEDLNSSNGTYVNGRRVSGRSHISLGDQVCFDDLEFRVTTAKSGSETLTDLHRPDNVVKFGRSEAAAPPGRSRPRPTRDPQYSPANPGKSGANAASDELQALLDFAGSGLTPQAPVPRDEANPFRLLKKGSEAPNESEPARRQEMPRERSSSQASAEPVASAAPHAQDERSLPRDLGAVSKASTDDDSTNFVSLNQLDRYVVTHEKYQQDLQVGSGPRLVVMTAPIRGKVFSLDSSEEVICWSIGRDDNSDICLRDKAVSREHAWITKLNSLYQLRVNDAANGILVNGRSCTEVDLRHGDRMQFGAIELVFRVDEKPPAPEETNAGASMVVKLWRRLLQGVKRWLPGGK